MDKILVDMIERPEFVDGLLDRILYEWNLPIIEQQLAIGIDGFYFAEDWGSETSLLFSPRLWRRFIKPRLAIMYAKVREAGAVVGQHSDGAIGPLFPDLIEIGLQVFNPLSPTIMDPAEYKAKYGDRSHLLRRHRRGAAAAVRHARRGARGDPPAGRAAGPGRRLHPAELAHHAGRRAHRQHRRIYRGSAWAGRSDMIVTVTLNPTLDKTLSVPALRPGEVHRARFLRQDIGGKGINVSRALAALGVASIPIGFLGGATGRAMRDGLTAARLRCPLRGCARRDAAKPDAAG